MGFPPATCVVEQRWNLLTEAEKKEGLHLTHRSFSQHVAQAVDCVGCRQSLEALVSKMYAAEVPVPEVRNLATVRAVSCAPEPPSESDGDVAGAGCVGKQRVSSQQGRDPIIGCCGATLRERRVVAAASSKCGLESEGAKTV
jgi:hypothetical protein